MILQPILSPKAAPMKFLILRNGRYFYSRRVPKFLKKLDNREKVRVALNTSCDITALKKMSEINEDVEKYWNSLLKTGTQYSKDSFESFIELSKQLGFSYVPASKLTEIPWGDLMERLISANYFYDRPKQVEAIMGSAKEKKILISEALLSYWNYSKPLIINKDPNQIRKWKNPRKKAIKNLIEVVGDKDITDLTNKDMVKLRDSWLQRISKEGIRSSSANKDFTHIKGVLDTVCAHEELDIDIPKLFRKIHLKDDNLSKRGVYSNDFIQNNILKADCLKYLDDEFRNMLYLSIETGARPIELLNLDGSNDIHLDCDIPHIHIRPRRGYSLKTKQSERKIPLVGKALTAFNKYPNGFVTYKGKPDQFSHFINSLFSQYGLKPTKNHTYYSLRHNFQDRLTAHEVKDRVQCQLMGHKFNRPRYGQGASLEHLKMILEKIKLT